MSETRGEDVQSETTEKGSALASIETAVLGVAGVADLFHAKPTLGSTARSVRHLTTPASAPRIVVDGDVLRVVIGTDGVLPAPRVARAVHDAALAEAARNGLVLARIDVRVARVG